MPTMTNPGNTSPGSCDGYATGYWDCCKPHCGWKSNVQGGNPLAACDKSDNSLGGNVDAQSACNGGNAYQCHNLVPWAVDDKLAYGYSAVPASALPPRVATAPALSMVVLYTSQSTPLRPSSHATT